MRKELSQEERVRIDRLREIRKNLNFSQEKFAEILEISCSAYKKIETYQHQISLDIITRLHLKLNVSADYILFGDRKDQKTVWTAVMNCTEPDKVGLFLRLYGYMCSRQEYYPYDGDAEHLAERGQQAGQKSESSVKNCAELGKSAGSFLFGLNDGSVVSE